ncbi:MAG: hypothetical protein VYE40_06240 [Myxococcota bacterium]|jgi:hypothetical protein|nr:hypothetical protein [Myxococcota bacterium]
MSKSKDHYDASSKVYWLFRDYDDPDTLVPNDELKAWSKVAREGKSENGDQVKEVNYIFADAGTAEYNSSALGFMKLGTYVGKIGDAKPFDGEDVSFDTREDFGM